MIEDGKPRLGDLRLSLNIHRLETRLRLIESDKSVVMFQPCQVTLFHNVYLEQDSGGKDWRECEASDAGPPVLDPGSYFSRGTRTHNKV